MFIMMFSLMLVMGPVDLIKFYENVICFTNKFSSSDFVDNIILNHDILTYELIIANIAFWQFLKVTFNFKTT